AVGQIARVRTEHTGNIIDALQVRRRFGDDQKAAPRQSCARRETETDLAGELIIAQIFGKGIRVVEFDELQLLLVWPGGRMVHDLRNGQTCPARTRTNGFKQRSSP